MKHIISPHPACLMQNPARSPTLSLFPSASPIRDQSPHRKLPLERGPLQRSATTLALISPQRPNFEHGLEAPKSQDQQHVVVVVHSPLEGLNVLEKPKASNVTSDLSRYSQNSIEASFHSAPDTPEVDAAPRAAVSHSQLFIRTASAKRALLSRTTRTPAS